MSTLVSALALIHVQWHARVCIWLMGHRTTRAGVTLEIYHSGSWARASVIGVATAETAVRNELNALLSPSQSWNRKAADQLADVAVLCVWASMPQREQHTSPPSPSDCTAALHWVATGATQPCSSGGRGSGSRGGSCPCCSSPPGTEVLSASSPFGAWDPAVFNGVHGRISECGEIQSVDHGRAINHNCRLPADDRYR
jgi:hypothetical protein